MKIIFHTLVFWLLLSAGNMEGQVAYADKGLRDDPGYKISWVGQLPEEGGRDQRTVGERVSGLIFGKKQEHIIKPFNVAALDPELIWVLDQGRGSIVRYNGRRWEAYGDIKSGTGTFPSLVGLCQLNEDNLLFTDSRTNEVHKVSNGKMSRWASGVSFLQPTGIAFSAKGNEVWVVETAAHRISILSMEGELLRQIGQRGTDLESFNYPTFIWIDDNGYVYIVDSMNSRIKILNSKGQVQICFGETGDATGNMARPKGVATDSHGHIYVSDALFHVVQVFDQAGKFLYSFGKQGQGPGEFWMPAGIHIDSKDFIYVADSYNSRIQIFQLIKTDVWGESD